MTRLLMLQESLSEGLRWANEAKRLALAAAGLSGSNLRAYEVELVYALAHNDRIAEALELLGQQEFEPREVRLAIEHSLRFLLGGQSELQLLRTGLRNAAQIGFIHLLDRARAPLAQICEAALAHGIEAEFVQRLISDQALGASAAGWAPLALACQSQDFGRLSRRYPGAALPTDSQSSQFSLELLKLLVACQALGREAPEKT